MVIIPEYICWPLAIELHIVTCEVISLWSLYHTVHVRLDLWRIPRAADYISDDTVQELDATTDLLDIPTGSTATYAIWSAIEHHMFSVLSSITIGDDKKIHNYCNPARVQVSNHMNESRGGRGAPAMIVSLASWFLRLRGLLRTWSWT
jgi:hypothetical protein